MLPVPRDVYADFEKAMAAAKVGRGEQSCYLKWLRYYWDFAGKYGHEVNAAETLPLFLTKLASKGQSAAQVEQASQAVSLYRELGAGMSAEEQATIQEPVAPYSTGSAESLGSPGETRKRAAGGRAADGPPAARSGEGFAGPWAKELASLSNAVQVRNYSPKTLQAYLHWTRKFCAFTGGKAAASLSTGDVAEFLTELAVRRQVAASTQNQAFNALLFFYRHVLGREFGKVEGVVRAKRRRYIPVVLSRREIDLVLAQLTGPYDLIVKLLYGCGLRISECLDLRIHCLNLDARVLTVHDGKGQKDRTVPLPETLLSELQDRLGVLRELHARDLADGCAGVFLPKQLDKKYRNAAREYIWQWLFPAPQLTLVRGTVGERRRWHLQASHVNQALRTAARAAALTKRVTPHTFRHSFASHLLQANYDIVTIQKLMGHSDVKTTMIYTQTVPSQTLKEARSPLDFPEDQRAPGDSGGS